MRYLIPTLIAPALLLVSCSKPSGVDGAGKAPAKPAIENVEYTVEETGEVDPIASPEAQFGGTFNTWAGPYPKSLNMWLDYNSFSLEVMGLLFEPLVTLHSTEDQPVGVLAQSWEISDDKTEFTFKIHPKAKWSDGKPITSEDVLFYYDTIMDPKNLTSLFRVSMNRLERPVAVNEKTVKVKANTRHWSNFWTASGLVALPKHAMEGQNFNDINFDFPVVSGPYEIDEIKTNRFISVKRRGDWWGRALKYNQNKFNFDYIRYRAMTDQTKVLEAFKKGDIDMLPIYTASIWARETNFPAVEKNWVVRQRIYNDQPMGYQGLAMNLRREKFQDVRVRQALSYLINREQMNDKLMYNEYFLLNSYHPDLWEDRKNPNAPDYRYNPEKARELLKQAGWEVNDRGILEKDGEPFELVFIFQGADQRHLNIYVESLRQVGIDARIEVLSASSFTKRRQNHEFDMIWMNWNATRLRDPEAAWSGKQANEIATNNVPGFVDAEVDALIEQQKTEMDLEKRNEILQKIDNRLTAEVPYVFLWGADNHRLLYWNKFGTPKYVLDRFNSEDSAVTYWWLDPEKEQKLEEARRNDETLEAVAEVVRFGE